MSTALRPLAFSAYAPEFEVVLGDAPRLSRVAEVDAHEGPVYSADENALYFTTRPKPGVDGAPSVQIKRLALDESEDEPVSVVVGEANAANGMAPDLEGRLLVCEQGHPLRARPHQPVEPDDGRAGDRRRQLARLGPQLAKRCGRRERRVDLFHRPELRTPPGL